MNYLELIYLRFKSDTPRFFKALILFFSILCIICIILVGAHEVYPFLHEGVYAIAKYLIGVFAVGAGISKLPTTDEKLSNIK